MLVFSKDGSINTQFYILLILSGFQSKDRDRKRSRGTEVEKEREAINAIHHLYECTAPSV